MEGWVGLGGRGRVRVGGRERSSGFFYFRMGGMGFGYVGIFEIVCGLSRGRELGGFFWIWLYVVRIVFFI